MPARKYLEIIGLISLTLLAWTAPVLAEDQPAATGQYSLGEVVVEAPSLKGKSVGTVREITAAEIEAMNATTLDQALKMVPGLVIRSGAEGVPRVDLRGYRSRHVLLLLNGVPFNSTYDGQFDPSMIPTENIARIKISYGTHSLLYGQGGMAGVINIITKAGGKGLGGSVKGQAGQGDSYLGSFNAYGGDEKMNLFASGSHYQRDSWPVSDDFQATSEQGTGDRVGSEKKRNNLFADLQYSPSPNWNLGLAAGGLGGEYQQPPSTINNNKDAFANSPKYDAVEDIQGAYGQAALSYQGAGPFSLRSWVYINHLKEDPKRYDNANYNSMSDPTVKTYDLEQKTDIYGLNLQTAYDFRAWGSLTLGLSAEQDKWDLSGQSRDKRISGTKKYTWRSVSNDQDLNIYLAALEYQVSPLPALDLTFGVSQNWLAKDGGDQDGTSYMAGARYGFRTGTALKGSFAHLLRFPSLRQLYEQDGGNADLDPERSDNFEVAVEQQLPHATLVSLTGFYSEVKDYIEKDADDIFQNNDKYRFQGIELAAQSRPLDGLWLAASYTFLDTTDLSNGSEKDELQYRPRHKIAFQGQYSWDFGFSVYAGVLYLADQVYYSKNEPLQQQELGDFAVVDLKLAQSFYQDMFSVYVGADNLFDKDYEESYGYPAPGRVIYAGLEARF